MSKRKLVMTTFLAIILVFFVMLEGFQKVVYAQEASMDNEVDKQQLTDDTIFLNQNLVNEDLSELSIKITTSEQLQELINTSTEEVELEIGNLEISQTVTIPAGKKIILSGNGTVTKKESAALTSFFEVSENSELTIQDGIVIDGKESKITGINVENYRN